MKDARFTIPTPALLAKVVDLLDAVPMEDRDTKGDLDLLPSAVPR
jgi:type I restriction enzyme M protein